MYTFVCVCVCACTLIKAWMFIYLPLFRQAGWLAYQSSPVNNGSFPSLNYLCEEGGRCCRWRRLPFITSLPQHTGRGRDAKPGVSSATRYIKTLTHFALCSAMYGCQLGVGRVAVVSTFMLTYVTNVLIRLHG